MDTSAAPQVQVIDACVAAGFPSPAEDLGVQRADLTALLVSHPHATFVLRVRGHSMTEAGILDGDLLVVDRAVTPRSGHIVVAMVDGDFTVKTLQQQQGRTWLRAAHPDHLDIEPLPGQVLEIWGVVTAAIHPIPH